MHLCLNLINWTIDIQEEKKKEKKKKIEILCTKSMESCSLVISDSGIVLSREGDIQNCIISSLKRIIQICLKFNCWVSKIAFYSPNPHCCLGKLPLEPLIRTNTCIYMNMVGNCPGGEFSGYGPQTMHFNHIAFSLIED